jgi:hypothetical protein
MGAATGSAPIEPRERARAVIRRPAVLCSCIDHGASRMSLKPWSR